MCLFFCALVAVVRFVQETVTITESDAEPTEICLNVTGEFAGRSVDFTVSTDNSPGEFYITLRLVVAIMVS